MNTHFNSGDDFNELVFENKNKAYGAYAIRKSYNDNVRISLLVTSAFFGLLALLAIYFTNKDKLIPIFSGGNDPTIFVKTTLVEIPKVDKVIIEKIEKVESTPKTSSGALTPSDDPKDLLDKTNAQLVISKNPNPFGNDSAAKDPDISVTFTPKAIPEAIVFAPDKMPELDNMAQFIIDNLKYPRIAVANGTHGAVYVTFVVESDGSLTGIELKNAIGDGCEQEAKRVIEKMPLWEPGIKGGKPVRVQCTLPINFRLK